MRKRLLWSTAAVFYIGAGLLHFLKTDAYVKIVPPHIPWPRAMVYLSGVAEIAGGAGLAVTSTRRLAASCLLLLVVAVFPANVYMAANHIQVMEARIPNWVLWARLPVQGLLIWWLVAIRSNSPLGRTSGNELR